MDTATNLRIVGFELDHVEALRAALEPMVGQVPLIQIRMEIQVESTRTIVSVTPDEISVREEPSGRVIAQGDWELARAALAGMPEPTPPPVE